MHSTGMKESEDRGENGGAKCQQRRRKAMKVSQRVQVQPGRPAMNRSQEQNCKVDKTPAWSP